MPSNNFPALQWWKGMRHAEFEKMCRQWEKKLRNNFAQIKFDHQLLVPGDGTGGHGGRCPAFFCGEAAFVEELPPGLILACFWTGSKDAKHTHYRYLPCSLLIFDETGTEEVALSITRLKY